MEAQMKRPHPLVFAVIGLCFPADCRGQAWPGIIDPVRRIQRSTKCLACAAAFVGLALIPTQLAYAIFPWPVSSASFETGAYVVWRTDVAGTSQVNYGSTSSYGSSSTTACNNSLSSSSYATYHCIVVSGLSQNTTYHFQVTSTDSGGNTTNSKDYTFTTLASPSGTVKTVKSSGGNYTSVQACATAASAGWTCEVYSGGASDTSIISVSNSGSSGSPIAFIAHDAVEVPGFSIAAGKSYITIEGFEISTAAYSGYQTCSENDAIAIGNGSNYEIIQNNYIHNVYWGSFIDRVNDTDTTAYTQILNNIMAFSVTTNQNPTYTYPCNSSCAPSCTTGFVGIVLGASNSLFDGNDIQEADHLIEVGGPKDIFRRNIAHDTYAADIGETSASRHIDFFHTPVGSGQHDVHQVFENNQDYNRNDVNEHFMLTETNSDQSSQSLGTGNGSTTTFSGTLSLGSDTAIAPFSVNVVVGSGGGTASVYDNGFGSMTGSGTGTITYSSGSISVTFSTAPTSGAAITAYYALASTNSHDMILRYNLMAYLGSCFIGGGDGGLSGVRAYNNALYHVGYQGGTTNNNTAINLFSSSSSVPETNWSAINNLFYDGWDYTGYTPWYWISGNAGDGAYVSPPEYAPGYSLVFGSACDPSPGCSYLSATTSAPGMVVSKNPNFNNVASYDFSLQAGSPAINAGTYLTTVASTDSGSGTSLIVNDAGFFQDGYGIAGVNPDCIAVTTVTNQVCITAVNYQTNTLTLASSITRSAGNPVWLYSDSTGRQVLFGQAPNIGATFGAAGSPPAPATGLTADPH
jgi:hypothetical protein